MRFMGYSDTVRHSLTFKVWNEETEQLFHRSRVKKIRSELDCNQHCLPPPDPPGSPNIPEVIISAPDSGPQSSATTFHQDELIGHTFLMNPKEDGTHSCAEIVGYIEEFDGQIEFDADRIKFKEKVGDEKQYLRDHGEKPHQQYPKEHGDKPHQPYLSSLGRGYHPELVITNILSLTQRRYLSTHLQVPCTYSDSW